jgi:hypothetical protein
MIRKFELSGVFNRATSTVVHISRIFKYSNLQIAVVKIALACLTVALLCVVGCSSGGWRVVDGDEFSIEFPGIPIDTATMVGETAGARLYFIPVDGGLDSNAYYAVSFYTLPDSANLLGDQLDDVFLKDAEIYAWSMGAFLADSGKVVMSGTYEGREYTIGMAQNAGIIKMRKFAKGKHLYTLIVITQNAYMDNKDVFYFLDSFKLK